MIAFHGCTFCQGDRVMPNGQLIVFGADVLGNPGIGTNSGAGMAGQGTATVQSGIRLFEDDDVVVFDLRNLDVNGELTDNARLADLTVYDSYEDYLAGIVKFDYRPQNPGQTSNLQSDLSGHGDGYARFVSANILLPDGTPTAPTFNQLLVAPSSGIAGIVGNGGSLTLDRNQDFDFNGDGDTTDPGEAGNNRLRAGDYVSPAICFTRGTMILTPTGERAIDDLRVGDLIWTLDNGPQPVRWIGRRRLRATGDFAPVRFAEGSIGNVRPLEVSQNHRMLRSGPAIELLFGTSDVLVAAKFLLDGQQVALRTEGWVEYVHLLFDAHEIILANGALSESLLPGLDTSDEDGKAASEAEVLTLFPNLTQMAEPGAASVRRSLRRFEADLL